MVAEAVKVAPNDLIISKQKHTDTALDATPATNKVYLGLANSETTVVIDDNLGEKYELTLTSLLRDNTDIFAGAPLGMSGVPKELAEHSLDVSKTAKPVKQKLCRFVKDRKEVIRVEIIMLLAPDSFMNVKNQFGSPTRCLYPRKLVNGECVSTTPISTGTAIKSPSLYRVSTRSLTPQLEVSCYASSTATQSITR
jgi:hypothetical protein